MMSPQFLQLSIIQFGNLTIIPSFHQHFIRGREVSLIVVVETASSEGIAYIIDLIILCLFLLVVFVVD